MSEHTKEPINIREELEGLAEAWADDACHHRELSNRFSDGIAETYQECSDELKALLERIPTEALESSVVREMVEAAREGLGFMNHALEFFEWTRFPSLEAEALRVQDRLAAVLAKLPKEFTA